MGVLFEIDHCFPKYIHFDLVLIECQCCSIFGTLSRLVPGPGPSHVLIYPKTVGYKLVSFVRKSQAIFTPYPKPTCHR